MRPGTIIVKFLEPIPPGLEREAFMALLKERIETASDRLIGEATRPVGYSGPDGI